MLPANASLAITCQERKIQILKSWFWGLAAQQTLYRLSQPTPEIGQITTQSSNLSNYKSYLHYKSYCKIEFRNSDGSVDLLVQTTLAENDMKITPFQLSMQTSRLLLCSLNWHPHWNLTLHTNTLQILLLTTKTMQLFSRETGHHGRNSLLL